MPRLWKIRSELHIIIIFELRDDISEKETWSLEKLRLQVLVLRERWPQIGKDPTKSRIPWLLQVSDLGKS